MWRAGDYELVTSEPLLAELIAVLERPKILSRLGWPAGERREFLRLLRESAIVVSPRRRLHVVTADPADDRVLEAAAEGEADYVVSGDARLLDLGTWEATPIVTPARFAAIITSGHSA